MVTIQLDMLYESFPEGSLVKGADVTSVNTTIVNGIGPDKLIVVVPMGSGGGNPTCQATFNDEAKARRWFAAVADDGDSDWFEENVVNRV